MKIEIWTDIVCPWCGLTNDRVDRALQAFEHSEDVEVVHRSYRIDPDAPMHPISVRNRPPRTGSEMTSSQYAERASFVERIAHKEGLEPYHVADNDLANTGPAHEFLAFATAHGAGSEAWALLFDEHFGKRSPIWSVDDLAALAPRLGLSATDARQALQAGSYRSHVQSDEQRARDFEAPGVPFIVIDERFSIHGAKRVDLLVDAFNTAWTARHDGAGA